MQLKYNIFLLSCQSCYGEFVLTQVWPDEPSCYQKRNKHICRQLSEGHILHMISTELICTSTSVSQSHSNTLLAAAVVKQTRIPTLIVKLEHCGVKVETVG